MKYFAALPFVLLAGCATAERVGLPDGTAGFVIDNCDSMASCYNKAAQVCRGKYVLLDRDTGSRTMAIPLATGGFVGKSQNDYSMTVKCGTPGN